METDNRRRTVRVSRPISRRLTRKCRAPRGPDWPSRFLRWWRSARCSCSSSLKPRLPRALLKEALIWLSAVALIVIIRRGEHLPMRSIGLGTARWWKSILWGFIIAIVSAVAVGRAGLCHWLRTRPGLCRVRETAAVVDHRDRFPRRSSGRIILSRLRDRTLADDWSRPVLVGGDSAGDFFAWPLVGWRCQHSHRIRSRLNPDRILFMASRSGGQHDRARPGGFRCERPAEIVFLTRRITTVSIQRTSAEGHSGRVSKAFTRWSNNVFGLFREGGIL